MSHSSTIWFLLAGALLIGIALIGTVLKRMPLTASMFYLVIGAALGPWGVGLLRVDPLEHAAALEGLTEIAVLISLFTAGLKLRLPLSDRRWQAAVLLAALAMMLTIGGVAAWRRWRSDCRSARRCCSPRCSRRPIRCSRQTCRSRTSTMPSRFASA